MFNLFKFKKSQEKDLPNFRINGYETWEKLNLEERENPDIAMEFLIFNCQCYKYIPLKLKKNRQFNLNLVEARYDVFGYMLADPDVNNDVMEDKEIVEMSIDKSNNMLYLRELKELNSKLINDKDIVLKAVKKQGSTLAYASETLKNDLEVVSEAMKTNTQAFRYIGKDFTFKPELIFNLNPIIFIMSSSLYGSIYPNLEGIKNNFKLKLLTDFEGFKDFENQWLKLIEIMDANLIHSNGYPTKDVMVNEFYGYLSCFFTVWKTETLLKLKDFSETGELKNKEFVNIIFNIIHKELEKRKLKIELEAIDFNTKQHINIKSRKLFNYQ
jgi:hypothetical protein